MAVIVGISMITSTAAAMAAMSAAIAPIDILYLLLGQACCWAVSITYPDNLARKAGNEILCQKQIELSGFVANELSAFVVDEKAAEGEARSCFLLGERRNVTLPSLTR
jgi:hypothetical protein